MPKRVLIAEDDTFASRLLEKYLTLSGYKVLKAGDGKAALRMILEHAPPIVITDWMMPEMSGIELCRALRTQEGIGSIYIVIVTAHSPAERLVEAFEAGADEFLAKPINRQELMARLRAAERIIRLEQDLARRMRDIHRLNAEMAVANEQLASVNEKLLYMATTDELTKLVNRREALNRLDQYWAHWKRHGHPFTAIMLDIDRFKRINDTHGHAAGDAILEQTAEVLLKGIRASDMVCRLGGEEFLVICQETDEQGGVTCAENLRGRIASHVFLHGRKHIPVTISLGVAEARSNMSDPDALLCAADEALYAAKNSGRNRVVSASESAMVAIGTAG